LGLGQFASHAQVRMEAAISLGLSSRWVSPCDRADPSDVDALPVKFVALAINALDINADGRESLNHPRFRVRAKVVVGHVVRL
jgi:hypothetical protein